MHDYQREFIQYSIQQGVLCFGEFILKSGRTSPYFFNSGMFNNGESLSVLGRSYASSLQNTEIEYDMLFGPAYKGIPLVAAVSMMLYQEYGRTVPYCFNRKEIKDHAEGGITVGAPLQGKILIVDDVISAGTSVRESLDIISQFNALPAGVLIALDRQERGQGQLSAVQETEQQHGIKVISVINLVNIIEYLKENADMAEHVEKIRLYQQQFGV